MSLDIGLLLLRLLVGFLLLAHATQKLAGWFSGPGLDKAAVIFEALGQVPGRPMAVLAAVCELVAAVLVTIGLGMPLASAVAAGTMLVAGAAMNLKAGTPWNSGGGGEYPFVLAAVAGVLAFTGAGAWSVDAALTVPWADVSDATETVIGSVAAAIALVAAAPPIARTIRTRRSATDRSTLADSPGRG